MLKLAKTCHDLGLCGLNESGEYELDPDGPNFGEEPIRVFCNFTTNATVINLDNGSTNEMKLDNCDGSARCASVNVSYEATDIHQILSIIEHSNYCSQEIVFSCNVAPLVLDGVSFASWRYRNGISQAFTQDNVECKCSKFSDIYTQF